MQYTKFRELLKDFPIFSLTDIRKIDPRFYRTRLNEWQAKGYVKKVRRGYYIFSNTKLDDAGLYFIANRLYAPSYISFEMALAYYGLIPESVYGITSATSRKRAHFVTPVGTFLYQQIKSSYLFGYTLMPYRETHFKIAEMEKALLDYLYMHADIKSEADFQALRFNGEVFLQKVDQKKLTQYAAAFHNARLQQRLTHFLHYLKTK